MNRSLEEPTQLNLYDRLYEGLIESAESAKAAVEVVVEAYLDGKPSNRGKKKITQAERDAAFWSSGFVNAVGYPDTCSDALPAPSASGEYGVVGAHRIVGP